MCSTANRRVAGGVGKSSAAAPSAAVTELRTNEWVALLTSVHFGQSRARVVVTKYAFALAALVALLLGSFGSAAASPTTADTGRSASHVASNASGQCSKAEAIAAVKRLGLRDVSPMYPVHKVLCGAFTGAGSQTMVALISGPDNVGMLYWAVFSWTGSEWQLLMKQRRAAVLAAAGSDIRETVSIYREGDSRGGPTGGTKTRIWHWDGSRFVAAPWKQVTKGKTEPRKPAVFRSPSGNIRCNIFDWGDARGPGVICRSDEPPQRVTMDASGRLKICRGTRCVDSGCGCVEGFDWSRLAYGRTITFRPFRCLSLPTGVRCTVIQSGKGFLINRAGVSRVRP